MEVWVSRIFPRIALNRRKGNVGGGQGAHTMPRCDQGPAPRAGVAALVAFFDSPLDLFDVSGKIGTLAFVSSNSENIS